MSDLESRIFTSIARAADEQHMGELLMGKWRHIIRRGIKDALSCGVQIYAVEYSMNTDEIDSAWITIGQAEKRAQELSDEQSAGEPGYHVIGIKTQAITGEGNGGQQNG